MEPISPELVLVDPALGAQARAAVSERPWIEPVRLPTADEVPAARPGRRPRRRALVAILVAALLVAAALATFAYVLARGADSERLTSSPAAPAGAVREPARAYSWEPYAGAVYYQVSFFRNGQSYYETRTVEPRLEFPANVEFAPGRYRWAVQPGVKGDQGLVLGPTIAAGSFELAG